MQQTEAAAPPTNPTGGPETLTGACPGLPRRRGRRAHAATTVHASLPLRPVTVIDGDGQPRIRLVVDLPEPTDRPIELQKRAI